MIGGADIIVATPNGVDGFQKAIEILVDLWPNSIMETSDGDPVTVNTADGRISDREIMIYKDMDCRDEWDKLGAAPHLENTMVYLLRYREDHMTIVVSDPNHPDMEKLLRAFRN